MSLLPAFRALKLSKQPQKPPQTPEPDPPPFRYLDLPAEIRNKISTYYLLNPLGIVPPPGLNLSPSPTYHPPSRRQRAIASLPLTSSAQPRLNFEPLPKPDTALMRVNKQLHAETVGIFWSQNVFYLLFGSLEESTQFYARMEEGKRKAIRHFALRINIQDLTQAVLLEIEMDATAAIRAQNPYHSRRWWIEQPTPRQWGVCAAAVLSRNFGLKFKRVAEWLGLVGDAARKREGVTVRLEFPRGREVFFDTDGEGVERREVDVKWMIGREEFEREVEGCVAVAVTEVGLFVEGLVRRMYWGGAGKVLGKLRRGEVVREGKVVF